MFWKVVTSSSRLLLKQGSSFLKIDSNAMRINSKQYVSVTAPKQQKEEVTVTFIRANGERISAKGKVGDHLLDVVVNNNIDLDGFGACEGTLICSTCLLKFKKEDFDQLPEKAGDEELDMLDLAFDLTDYSRLGCQITLTKDLDGFWK